MAAVNSPGLIGTNLPFVADGSVDSSQYVPRNGSLKITLMGVPTQPGTVMPRVHTPFGDFDLAGSAVAVAANDLVIVEVAYALYQIGTVYLRFTNNNTTPGTCSFAASDGGGY